MNEKNINKKINENNINKKPIDNNINKKSNDNNINKNNKDNNINNNIKENNINKLNKNTQAPFQGLTLNKGIQSNSHYNLLNVPNLNSTPSPTLNLAKVTKLNEQNINPNIINNNLHNVQALNNNLYANQLYLLNRNQLLNGNNNLLLINPNINQQLLNNPNLVPGIANIATVPIGIGMPLNSYNKQNIANNNQQRLTNIPLTNRYALDNNINIEKERLTAGYQMPNRENILLKYPNNLNLFNNPNLPQQINNQNIINANNQILIQQQLQNKNPNIGEAIVNNSNNINKKNNNINNNNVGLNQNINQQNLILKTKPSMDSLSSQLTNNYSLKERLGISNELINNRENLGPRDNISNKVNLQAINNRENLGPRDNISNKVNLHAINNGELLGPRDNIGNNIVNNRQIIVPKNNVVNNMNLQTINNRQIIAPSNNINNNNNRLTIVPNNDNIINNNDRLTIVRRNNSALIMPFKSINNQYINQINNQQLNILNNPNYQTLPQESQNDNLNDYLNKLYQNPNTYIEHPQNNYNNTNDYSKFLQNYSQNQTNNQIDGNFLLRDYGFLSRPGSDDTGMTKTNQDSYISKTNINGLSNFNIFGVLDGHGPDGHFVSEFASEFIPNQIINNHSIRTNTNPGMIYNILKQNNYQIIKQAFLLADNKLKTCNFNARESGTTCVLIIHIGNHLICANVGDSRAIVAFNQINDPDLQFLRAIPLSIDYKPELPEEKARILMSGGVVEQVQNSFGMMVGPYRVFAPGKDYPGLAMSRSIGDLDGKNLGLIAEPGIMEYNINSNTKFIILCSDGVWEFLTNENVKNIGKQFYLNSNASELCQELITRSVIEWEKNDNTVDDITCIAIFF